jgi:ribose 5-phosphate isomerase A
MAPHKSRRTEKQLIERARQAAGSCAAGLVPDRSLIGLGSGSTIEHVIKELGRRRQQEGLEIEAVATSFQAEIMASECGIPVRSMMTINRLDLTIDGADQVDPNGNMLKGKGGAQTLEKITALLSDAYLIVVDQTKKVPALGQDMAVPVAVLPQALGLVRFILSRAGYESTIRPAAGKAGPVVTDLGNIIIDVDCGPIDNVEEVLRKLKNIPGIVGNGLFIGMVDKVITGKVSDGKVTVEKQDLVRINKPENLL